jgi:hypothetical protein
MQELVPAQFSFEKNVPVLQLGQWTNDLILSITNSSMPSIRAYASDGSHQRRREHMRKKSLHIRALQKKSKFDGLIASVFIQMSATSFVITE